LRVRQCVVMRNPPDACAGAIDAWSSRRRRISPARCTCRGTGDRRCRYGVDALPPMHVQAQPWMAGALAFARGSADGCRAPKCQGAKDAPRRWRAAHRPVERRLALGLSSARGGDAHRPHRPLTAEIAPPARGRDAATSRDRVGGRDRSASVRGTHDGFPGPARSAIAPPARRGERTTPLS